MTHVMMPGSDSEDFGFGDDLALPARRLRASAAPGLPAARRRRPRAQYGGGLQASGEGVSLEPRAGAPETRGEA